LYDDPQVSAAIIRPVRPEVYIVRPQDCRPHLGSRTRGFPDPGAFPDQPLTPP